MVYVPRGFVLIVALFAVVGLAAQTVYKSVDEKGNVIYSESPPTKTKDGKIRSTTELPIDPNQNVFPAQKPTATGSVYQQQRGQAEESERSHAEKVAAAQAALDAAEVQLKAGTESQPGDFVGRASGGVGPSQQRLQRLDELQRAVDEARKNLEKTQSEPL